MEFGTLQIIEVLLILVFLGLSAFFSGSETAYTGLSRARLKAMDPDGVNRKVQRAISNHEDFDRLLTTILVGNNIVNTASAAVCTALLIEMWPEWGTLIATILMITVLLVVGEITPKTLAKHNAEQFAVSVSGWIHFVMVVLSPITFFFLKATKGIAGAISDGEEEKAPTDEETTAMIDEILEEGNMESAENELIRSAMEFDDKAVSEICIPRVDMVAVSKDASIDEIKEVFVTSGFTRLPVYEDTIDRVIGYVSMKDFFFGMVHETDSLSAFHPVRFFPTSTGLDEVIRDMQKSQAQIGIVLDDYGGTFGMVTMEDLVEELVGEIYDESDEVHQMVVPEQDGTFTVSGDANIFEVMEALGHEFDCEDFDSVSVGGYIAHVLERIPRVGDEVRAGDMVISVKSYHSRRVREASFRVEPLVEDSEDEEKD